MQNELSNFEGKHVQVNTAKISGTTNHRVPTIANDEQVIVISRAYNQGVNHKEMTVDKAELFGREHSIKCVKTVVLSMEDGARLLEEALTLADENFGISSLLSEIVDEPVADGDTDDE